MNLNPMGGYGSHKVVHSAGSRDRGYAVEHRRAAEEARFEARKAVTDSGFVSSFLARWRRRATIAMEPAVEIANRKLTDSVCLLADGSLGRILLRRIDGRWVEDCVPV